MCKKVLVATNNPSKKKLFNYIFKELGIEPTFLDDVNLSGEKIVEDGETVIENALKKARHFHKLTGIITFGDDAGVEIDALNGEPGLKARRWNGIFEDSVDDETWLNYLLERMKDIPYEKRTGKFISGWAFVNSDGTENAIENISSKFLILENPIRPYGKGWPMEAVQFDIEQNMMFKDLNEDIKYKRVLDGFKEWDILSFLK